MKSGVLFTPPQLISFFQLPTVQALYATPDTKRRRRQLLRRLRWEGNGNMAANAQAAGEARAIAEREREAEELAEKLAAAAEQRRREQEAEKTRVLCEFCYLRGHDEHHCPDRQCRLCFKMGHSMFVCPKRN